MGPRVVLGVTIGGPSAVLYTEKYLQIMIIYLRAHTPQAIPRPAHAEMLSVTRRAAQTGAADALVRTNAGLTARHRQDRAGRLPPSSMVGTAHTRSERPASSERAK